MKVYGKNFTRYENEEGKLHNENGPALIDFSKPGNDYNEWWENGVLHAVFDKNVLKRTTQNSFNTLEEVELPKKWKGYETTLSISDLKLLQPVPQFVEITPEITDGYRSDYQNNPKTNQTYSNNNGAMIERNSLENGKLHKQDGPALKNLTSKYSEWWDQGRLVATFEEGILKRSIDGTFTGLKEVNVVDKWKGYEKTLSLTDLEHCGFKPELVQIEKELKNENPKNDMIEVKQDYSEQYNREEKIIQQKIKDLGNISENKKPMEINTTGIKGKISEMRKSYLEKNDNSNGLKMK